MKFIIKIHLKNTAFFATHYFWDFYIVGQMILMVETADIKILFMLIHMHASAVISRLTVQVHLFTVSYGFSISSSLVVEAMLLC